MENPVAVAEILKSFNGEATPEELTRISRALWEADLHYGEIARILRDKLAVPAEEIARALYSKDGPGIPGGHIAFTLRENLGLSTAEIVNILRNIGLDAYQIAYALYRGIVSLNLRAEEVVRILYAEDGLNLDAETTACVMYSWDGMGLGVDEMAFSFGNIGMAPADVVRILYRLLCSEEEEECVIVRQKKRIARALMVRGGLDMPRKEAAKALEAGLGASPEEVAKIMSRC